MAKASSSSSATSPSPSPSPSPLLAAQARAAVAAKVPNPNATFISSQAGKAQESHIPQILAPPPQALVYSVPATAASRVVPSQAVRSQPSDQLVTVANLARSPPVLPYPAPARSFNYPADHTMRPPTHQNLPRQPGGVPNSGPPRTIPPPQNSKPNLVPTITSITEYKMRDKSRDDSVVTIQGRKVRLSDGGSGSLYALCRSWVRNGWPQECQPQLSDGGNVLPRPFPASSKDSLVPEENESDDQDDAESGKGEHVGSVDDLSAQDLLKEHIKRAKRIRARLREERLRRIQPYRERVYSVIERIRRADVEPPMPSPEMLGVFGHSLKPQTRQ
ncbi:hypothetical protein H6P81_004334 [Aristolochia fimbriata]|uniref:Uncharacterized protein n=1 Tax=Aristolochia fimbriata TaxID=158543 RepID=A0AAV7FHS9_ARIFI|nr:hypothetical protein H6P81_004334 [Aristolochia fimbriata]